MSVVALLVCLSCRSSCMSVVALLVCLCVVALLVCLSVVALLVCLSVVALLVSFAIGTKGESQHLADSRFVIIRRFTLRITES